MAKKFKIVSFICRGGNAWQYIAKDSIDAFRRLNQDVLVFDFNNLPEDMKKRYAIIANFIIRFKPDFIFTIGLVGLPIKDLYQKLKIPFCSWITTELCLLPPLTPLEYHYLFLSDKTTMNELSNKGYTNLYYLPLASNPDKFKKCSLTKEDLKRYGSNLSFVGTLNKDLGYQESREVLRRLFTEEVTEEMIERKKKDSLLPIERIFNDIQKEKEWLQDFSLDKIYFRHPLWRWLKVIEYEGLRRYRIDVIKSVAPFGVSLYGDPGWKEIAHPNVKYMGKATHEELIKIYNATKINLNIIASPLKDAVNVSTLNIPTCSSFMLSNFRGDLIRLFREGEEVVYFKDKEDLQEKVDYYLRNEEERIQIAKRGRERILKEHTFVHRMKRVLEIMENVF